jgi:hypothetical protein
VNQPPQRSLVPSRGCAAAVLRSRDREANAGTETIFRVITKESHAEGIRHYVPSASESHRVDALPQKSLANSAAEGDRDCDWDYGAVIKSHLKDHDDGSKGSSGCSTNHSRHPCHRKGLGAYAEGRKNHPNDCPVDAARRSRTSLRATRTNEGYSPLASVPAGRGAFGATDDCLDHEHVPQSRVSVRSVSVPSALKNGAPILACFAIIKWMIILSNPSVKKRRRNSTGRNAHDGAARALQAIRCLNRNLSTRYQEVFYAVFRATRTSEGIPKAVTIP